MKRFFLLFFLNVLVCSVSFAQSDVVRIPLKTFTKPAQDLLSQSGKELSIADLTRMYSEGYDLSKLQPVENKYWQNYGQHQYAKSKWNAQKLSAVDLAAIKEMPDDELGVDYESENGSVRQLGLYSILVKPNAHNKLQQKSQRYVLNLGQQAHASLLRAALLRKLGYYQESPRYYPKIKVHFSSAAQKQDFIDSAFCENELDNESNMQCISIAPFKTDKKPNEYLSHAGEKSLYIHGAYLFKMNPEVPGLFDGLVPIGSSSLIPYFSQSRAYRSLIIPFVISNIEESVNRFSTECASIRGGVAYLNYPFSFYFQDTDHSDVKWVLRRVAQLTDQDWDEIIQAGHFPKSLVQLVKAKILLRTKDCLEVFFDEKDPSFYSKYISKPEYKKTQLVFRNNIPDLIYTSEDGYVKNGKVITEYIPGYPQRFSHGERQSPFMPGDILKYLKIEVQSSLIGVATSELNKKLSKMQSQSQLDGFKLTDQGYKPFGHTDGYQLGVNYSAARLVTTGSFYGSQATVQLVDNVSMSIGLGVYRIFHEVSGFNNLTGLNGFLSRDFTHVRPIESMKETETIPWKSILVKSELERLASPLKDGKLTEFIEALKPGEVFTITDSIGGSVRTGASIGLDNLIGFTGKTVPTFGFSANVGNQIILSQTQIIRTANGFQIYLRSRNSKVLDLMFDANYFINVLKITHSENLTDILTQAYNINYNFSLISQVDQGKFKIEPGSAEETNLNKQIDFSKKLAGALRGLIFSSNSDQLNTYFQAQKFDLKHDLLTQESKMKFLWLRASKFTEGHKLTISKPILTHPGQSRSVVSQTVRYVEYDENGQELPQKKLSDQDLYGEVKNQNIEISTYKLGEMTGRDYLGFGLNFLDGLTSKYLKQYAPQLSKDNTNSANMPFGRAQWHTVRADSELTQNRVGAFPSVVVIQNVWGGWSLKKAELENIISKIQNRFKGTEFENEKFFPDKVFYSVDKIDFFRITENISLLPGALSKVKDLVVYPEIKDIKIEKAKFLSRLFQKLSQIGSESKSRPEDKAIFTNLMTLLGQGSESRGKEIYLEQCQKTQGNKYHPHQNARGAWLNGVYYECLEPWIDEVISISRKFSEGSIEKQNKWMAELIFTLEKNIPTYVLLKAIGRENYLYYTTVVGFRVGDENADNGIYISRTLGEPARKNTFADGLMSAIAEKSGLSPLEIAPSNTSVGN